jgi:hypothetical protein
VPVLDGRLPLHITPKNPFSYSRVLVDNHLSPHRVSPKFSPSLPLSSFSLSLHLSLSPSLLSNPSLAETPDTYRTKRTYEPQSQSQKPTHGISEHRLPATRGLITLGSRAAEHSSSRQSLWEIHLIPFPLFHSTNNSTKEAFPITPGSNGSSN